MKRDDTLWKAILEDVFDDFLRFFFAKAEELFDLNQGFEYLDKELEQLFPPDEDLYAPRYVDKLVKVVVRQTGQSQEQWILIHIEIQGYKDADFAQRMFQYYYRIYDKYRQPITAFAIFTDSHKGFAPSVYEQSYLGTQLLYRYNTYKIQEQSEAELLASENPFALVIATVKAALTGKRMTADELVAVKLEIAKRLLLSSLPKAKVRSLMNFLRYYVRLENQQASDKFEQGIASITDRSTTMGIEQFLLERAKKEGVQKGIEQGVEKGIEQGINARNLAFTKTLLRETVFTTAEIARLVGVPVSFVEEVKKQDR